MASSSGSSLLLSKDFIKDLLYGLDDRDGYLESLITSGQVPQNELRDLYQNSLLAGAKDWDMLIQCATSLKDQAATNSGKCSSDVSIFPFLEYVLSAQPASDQRKSPEVPKKKNKNETVAKGGNRRIRSHFWSDTADAIPHARTNIRFDHDGLPGTGLPGICKSTKPSGLHPETPKRPNARICDETAPAQAEVSPSSPGDDYGGTAQAQLSSLEIFSQDPSAQPESRTGNEDYIEDFSFDLSSPDFSQPNFVHRPKHHQSRSPYFTPSPTRPPRGTISSLPIPPLSAPRFGLIQEELAADPFQLLVAVTFLVRTKGRDAIPVFRALVARFPTPAALAAADPDRDVVPLIRHLGFGRVRCAALLKYARIWAARPPRAAARFGVRNYPSPGDGKGVRAGEEFGPEDAEGDGVFGSGLERAGRGQGEEQGDNGGQLQGAQRRAPPAGSAWEIGHLTQGRYAIDSWRIFCRDVLLGRAQDWNGRGAGPAFEPEWMRVLPADKELRACLRWMWMRGGWEWDPATGAKKLLAEEMRCAVNEGRVGYDERGALVILR